MKFKYPALFCSIALLLFTSAGFSEELNITDAISLSLKSNNSYLAAAEKAHENKLKVDEAWSMLWPSLSSDFVYARQDADSGFTSSVKGAYNINFISGQFSLNPGVFYNSLRAAQCGHVIAENDMRKVKSDTEINTIQSFYQLLLARESLKIHRLTVDLLRENYKMINSGYDKGLYSKLDYLRSKVALSNEEATVIQAENSFYTMQSRLNILLNRPLGMEIILSNTPISISDEELKSLKMSAEKENIFVNSMITEALKNRPEMISIEKGKEAQEYAGKIHQSLYLWPSFFIKGNWGTAKNIYEDASSTETATVDDATLQGLFAANQDVTASKIIAGQTMSTALSSLNSTGWSNSWQVQFGATYQWSNWLPVSESMNRKKQSDSQVKQTELQLADFVKGVELDVKSNYLNLKSAANSLEAQKGNIETAEEALKAATAQFKNGLIDNTKFLEATVDLNTAQTLYIQSIFQFQLAKAQLNRATGKEYFRIK